jgi:23S rRNA (guanosine2251-2'-O)-methyltransferase
MSDDLWTFGFHAVLGLLESGQPVDALLLQRDRRDARSRRIVEEARRRDIRFDLVPRARLDRMAGSVAHNGCAARSAPVAFVPLQDLVRPTGGPGNILLLDDVVDPHNLGAVLRTAAAFAVDGVVIAGPSAPPLGGAVAKAAAGLLGRVPMARASVGADALARLRENGYWVFAADAAGTPLDEVNRIDRWVLVVGAEERGLRAKTKSAVDEFVAIRMAEGVDSLNLSVSAGILLWELSRPPTKPADSGC